MSQLEKLAEQLHPRPRPEPLTEREELIRAVLDQPIRADQDYLELLRKITCKGESEILD
jgi:hypothetical protein